ncbi:MAG: PLP-dependent aminotransferase family protein [Acinetobacter sp.]
MDEMIRTSKVGRVIHLIQQQIADRILIRGSRLPSVRTLAKQQQISVSTVVEAYARLIADEVIESRQGAGYFVCGSTPTHTLTTLTPRLDREIDPLWISRQTLEVGSQMLKPGCGWLPESWMPEQVIRKALRTVSRGDIPELVNYAPPHGYAPLRQLIARRIEMTGVHVNPDQIMLTESGTHAIDLIARLFLNAGDVVLVDDPCYFNFHALLKVHQVKTIAIPFTQHGPDLEAFQLALRHRPRVYITNSGVHNPTGARLSLSTAYQILKWVEQTDMRIVEDDIFADFELHPAPRYAALNGFSHVIQVGSFSKTLSASVRCGYIAASTEWTDRLVDLKIATCFNNNYLNMVVLYHALNDSHYRKHLDWLKTHLAQAMSHTIRQLETLQIRPWHVPQAGMFLWCQIPEQIDAAKLSTDCLQQGVILAPGQAFSQSADAAHYLRFNVAQSLDAGVYQVLAQAMAVQQP